MQTDNSYREQWLGEYPKPPKDSMAYWHAFGVGIFMLAAIITSIVFFISC